MLRGLFVLFSPDSHVLTGSRGDGGWLTFVNTSCRHLEKRKLLEAECKGSDDHSGHSRECHLPPRAGGDRTDLQRILDSFGDQAHLSKNISAEGCLL